MDKKKFELTEKQALEVGQYLKNRREKLNYSTNHIELHTGIDKADLSRIESGKKKKINPMHLKELANALKIDQVELFNKAGYIDTEYTNNGKILDVDFMSVPVFSSVSAGVGCDADPEPIDYILIPKMNGEIVAIKVDGDSMEDTIMDGAMVVVDRNSVVEIGDIGVFLTLDVDYSEGLVKRLKGCNGKFILGSDNKKYKDIVISKDNILIYGKVIKVLNDTYKQIKDPLYDYIDMLDSSKRALAKKMLQALIDDEDD